MNAIEIKKDSKGIWNVRNSYTRQWLEFATEAEAINYIEKAEATHTEIEAQAAKLANGEISLSDFLNDEDED